VLGEAASAALDLGETEAARVLQVGALDLARQTGSSVELAAALMALAAIEIRMDRTDLAAIHLEEAAAQVREEKTPGLEQIVQAKLLEIRALAGREIDPRAAIADFSAALQLSEQLGYRAQVPPLLLERAKVRVRTGNADEALDDLEMAIGFVEAEWEEIRNHRAGFSDDIWAAYFRDRRRFFDEAIDLLVSRGGFDLAFDYAEQARARDLLDLLQRPGVTPERRRRSQVRSAARRSPRGSRRASLSSAFGSCPSVRSFGRSTGAP
jgi:hypothetical protein